MLHSVTQHYTIMLHSATRCYIVLHSATRCYMVLHSVTQHYHSRYVIAAWGATLHWRVWDVLTSCSWLHFDIHPFQDRVHSGTNPFQDRVHSGIHLFQDRVHSGIYPFQDRVNSLRRRFCWWLPPAETPPTPCPCCHSAERPWTKEKEWVSVNTLPSCMLT